MVKAEVSLGCQGNGVSGSSCVSHLPGPLFSLVSVVLSLPLSYHSAALKRSLET